MTISREQITAFLLNSVSLSRKDKAFVQHIYDTVVNSKPVTVNQSSLWDHLIVKYRRQLDAGLGTYTVAPDWAAGTIPSRTTGTLRVSEDRQTLLLLAAWDRTLIRAVDTWWGVPWDPTQGWAIPFNMPNLRKLSMIIAEHNLDLVLSPELVAITGAMTPTPEPWIPALVETRGGQWVISGITETQLAHLPNLASKTVNTIRAVANLGIKIHPRILDQLEARYSRGAIKIASTRDSAVTEVSQSDIAEYVRECNISHVFDVRTGSTLANDLPANIKLWTRSTPESSLISAMREFSLVNPLAVFVVNRQFHLTALESLRWDRIIIF